MKTLFYYLYYRYAQGYRYFGDGDYLDWGYFILFASFMNIACSIAVPISYIFDTRLTKATIVLIAIPFIFLYIRTFFIPEEQKKDLFKQLEKRYKNEPHKKLKGWLVALYAIGTLVLFHIMCIFFVLK